MVIGTPARRRKAKREQAERLRREAEEKLASSARREVAAKQEAAAAERERETAEQAIAQADALDPDVPDSRSEADPDAVRSSHWIVHAYESVLPSPVKTPRPPVRGITTSTDELGSLINVTSA